MYNISISPEVKAKCPHLQLACVCASVITKEQNDKLWERINLTLEDIQSTTQVEDISKTPTIQSSRKAYKALGKDPARYRLSAEAMLRRIVKGKGLYKINNLVDLLNLISVQTGYSIGGYNANKIDGDIVLGIGAKDEPYQGIGRGELNIEFLPVFRDQRGAFGSPTSDCVRTSVDGTTKTFLVIIFNFGGHEEIEKTMDLFEEYLVLYANASDIKKWIIT